MSEPNAGNGREDDSMDTEVGFNQEYAKLRLQHAYLKEECANLIEMYSNLVTVVGPNLETDYRVKVGLREHRVMELTLELRRWQRRMTLRQEALNRGEKPDYVAIERRLDEEFAAFRRKVREREAELEKAVERYNRGHVGEKRMTEIRTAYLAAVKRLHPDLNPDLPEAARGLWMRIQEAYAERDWTALDFLVGLVDGAAGGGAKFAGTADGLEEMRQAVGRLRKVCDDLRAKTAELKGNEPYSLREFLENPEEVKVRQDALDEQAAALEARIAEYRQAWKEETDGE